MSGLIGRDADVAAITHALQRPDLAGLVLVGEAGIGKTHLMAAAIERAASAGFAVAHVTGSAALADLPLAAFAPLLSERPRGDAGDLVAIRHALRDLAAGRPLVLGVDDAHFLDDASAAIVHQLAADLSAFVIGTVRSGEIPPDAVTALWKDRLAQRLDVGPLDRRAIGELGAATLGTPLDPALEDELWRRSAGNPLFARELLLSAAAGGAVAERDGRSVRVAELPAPATVTELFVAQLSGLDEAERRAVDLLAVGGALDVDVLERLVDPDVLVRLEAERVLVADEVQGRLEVRFAHPLHADAARQVMGRLVARQLRRELADAIEAAGGATTDEVLRIVSLRLESGGQSSPTLLARASRIALRRNDAALAERLARASMQHEPRLTAAVALAAALVEQGRQQEALDALMDPTVDRTAASADERARALLLEANIRFWGLGDAEDALATIAAAGDVVTDEWADQFRAAAAAIEACRGHVDEALRLVPPGSPAARSAFGAVALLVALAGAGRPDAALAAVELPPESFDGPWSIVAANYAFALVDAGRIVEAGDLAIERWEAATRSGALHARVGWAVALGWIELHQGRTAAARRWFDEAAALAPVTGASLHGQRWALGGALYCATQLDDRPEIERLLARIDALPPHDAVVHEQLGLRGRAWALRDHADVERAVARLVELATEATEQGRHGHALHALTDVARLDRPELAAQHVAMAERPVDGALFPALLDSVGAFARGDGPALAEAAERLHDLGAVVLAAEAASGAFALARERGEDQRVVAARQRRAQELSVPVAHLATPGLAVAPRELPLSRRERQIAALVAEGRTSREVAEELVIGVRTVESHLARVFDKLGISSRSELPDALGMTGAAR